MSTLIQDLLFGLRMWRKHPGFTSVAVLTLALGIGANATIFSFVNALLLRPLAGVTEPQRLVHIGRTFENRGSDSVSYPDYFDYCEQNTVLSGIALTRSCAFHLSTGQEAERVNGALVSGNYFEVLGAKAARGRLLTPADGQKEGESAVAVISYGLWQRRFGGEANVAGKTVSLNAHRYTIIGVVSDGFGGVETGSKVDVWSPVTMWRQAIPEMARSGVDFFSERDTTWLESFGRLKPGVSVAQAQAEMSAIAQRLALAYPQTHAKIGVKLTAGLGIYPEARDAAGKFSLLLMGAVGLVLLIACANVAGLLLARSSARQKEIGIRLALGAGRARIVRQLLTESLMLAVLGGVWGLFVALWLGDWLRGFLPSEYQGLPLALDVRLDWRVLSFTFTVSVLTGILFGVAPAWRMSQPDLVPVLKETHAAGNSAGRLRLRGALVVVQMALSLVLMIGAGLCVRTLRNAQAINTGFETNRVLTARIDLGRQNYTKEQGENFYRQFVARTQSLPGVQSASLALNLPLTGNFSTGIYPQSQAGQRVQISFNIVTPRYFETMSIPLVLGRHFSEQDNAQSPRVAIINETLARRFWPNENPVGQRFGMKKNDDPKNLVEIIGVARDAKGSDLFEPPRVHLYLPLSQRYQSEMTLHLRTTGEPEQLAAAVRREASALDRNLPVYEVRPLSAYLKSALTPQRLTAALISGFGLLALALAAVGLYGVIAYAMTQRTHEIGIRMALGAQPRDVFKLVIKQGMRLALMGVAIGLIVSVAVTRLMTSLLFGVGATDPVTFGGIALLLGGVALLACYLPARRAAKVDPMVALRYE